MYDTKALILCLFAFLQGAYGMERFASSLSIDNSMKNYQQDGERRCYITPKQYIPKLLKTYKKSTTALLYKRSMLQSSRSRHPTNNSKLIAFYRIETEKNLRTFLKHPSNNTVREQLIKVLHNCPTDRLVIDCAIAIRAVFRSDNNNNNHERWMKNKGSNAKTSTGKICKVVKGKRSLSCKWYDFYQDMISDRLYLNQLKSKLGLHKGHKRQKRGAVIDFTDKWMPKYKNKSSSGKKLPTLSKVFRSMDGTRAVLSSGGFQGKATSGFSSAEGSLHIGLEAYDGKHESSVKINAPSGQASTHGIGIGGDLSISAGIISTKNQANIGVNGPKVNANIGPVGVEYSAKLGVEGSTDFKKGAGGKVSALVGTFGVEVGCKTEICIFGCVSIKVC